MIYELLIELDRIEPKVWRRVRVDSETSMRDFHHILQLTMGWENCHLYCFSTEDEKITQIEFLETDDFLEDHEHSLSEFLSEVGDTIVYTYDFGDDWRHNIRLEKVLDADEEQIPRCLEGKRNAPPEDVGGVPGYENFIEIIADPRLPEYDEMIDWYGGVYDPEEFRLAIVNEDLEALDDYIDSLDEDWLY
jgi:hypothetical protein